ncbi:M36 family metallopeptidase [Bryobacter aggregatus]|uniref:M36 family metallopeptidase n=1 Tax=Bryobacter aggregatus TaxID=360054 RepID=UPI00056A786B|nr:M36 family metallopeptidase [Bryobacter aggregatus]
MKHLTLLFILSCCAGWAQLPDAPGIYLAKEYQSAHNGVTHRVYQQRFQGIEVYGAAWVVNLDSNGEILNSAGTFYPDPGSVALPSQATAFESVRSAIRAVNPKLAERYAPLLSAKASAKGLRFAAASLGEDIDAELVWYPIRGALQPAWKFLITDEDGVNSFTTIVESATKMLLHNLPNTDFFQAKGLVFERESPQPNPTPGIRLTAAPPYVNRSVQPFPSSWVATNQTVGNNTITGQNLLGQSFITNPRVTSSTGLDFSFPLELGSGAGAGTLYPDASNTNLFYWVNRAHDLHYENGFDEAAGNFQQDNFGKGGTGGDPVLAYTHYGAQSVDRAVYNNAFFSSRGSQDGGAAMLAMYLGSSGRGGYLTDGALDAGVIIHEYTHGVSRRLANNVYSTFQGAAMGEAWSDFFGLEYTLPQGSPANGTYLVAEYFDQTWGTGDFRTRPYSTDPTVNSLTFANLGQVIAYPEVHADGEIWMEALWEARANLIAQLGEAEGRRRIRLLVLDGMKLMPPQGTMIDARDAILLADRVDFKGESQSQLWAAFAKRGLGALAYTSGGNTVHVHPSFAIPSAAAQFAFYDEKLTIGETVRILLSDLNNNKKSTLVQVLSDSGDLEDLLLTRTGTVFSGVLPSSGNALLSQNGTINLMPGDGVTAYYVDADDGTGKAKLVTTSATFTPPYALTALAPNFSFSGERDISFFAGSTVRLDIPFEFPFYDKKLRSMYVHLNGLISFGLPGAYTVSSCTDGLSLANYSGIAPLWAQLNYPRTASQGIFVSYPTPKSMTIRWSLETYTAFAVGRPVNFAVTLTDEGLIQVQYGPGNVDVGLALTGTGCGAAPVAGISPGRDSYSQRVVFAGYENTAVKYEPPFNSPSLPVVEVESPKANDKVKSLLTITGIVYDEKTALSRVDVLIDRVNRGRATLSVSRPDYCRANNVPGCPRVGFTATIDLKSLGLTPGPHTLALRATNIRGAFEQYPATPIPFEMEAGDVRLPYGKLESPAAGAELSGSITVSGYAFADDLRIVGVDTLIDGVTYGPTSYGMPRADICAGLSPLPVNCPLPGFRFVFNSQTVAPALPNGKHQIQIRVRDELGRSTLIPDTPVEFTVKNDALEKPVGVLLTPGANEVLSGIVKISGYGYTATGRITAMTLLVDGAGWSSIPFNQPLPEVCATLEGVSACPNIGFSVNFDTRKIPNGPHILGVQIVNDKGGFINIPTANSYGTNVLIQN